VNITHTEWLASLEGLSAKLQRAARFARVTHDSQAVRIATESTTATVQLVPQLVPADRHTMIPRVRIGSSSCLPSDVLRAQAQLTETQDVLNLAIHAQALVGHTAVWLDGDCPCSACSGTGKVRRVACRRCEGTGKR